MYTKINKIMKVFKYFVNYYIQFYKDQVTCIVTIFWFHIK